jgi:hypothetical protein
MLLAFHALALAAMGLALAPAHGGLVPAPADVINEARSARSDMAKRMAAFQTLSRRVPYTANP